MEDVERNSILSSDISNISSDSKIIKGSDVELGTQPYLFEPELGWYNFMHLQ